MKALSIKEPWATLIIHHGKTTENRSWFSHYKGEVLICASRIVDLDTCTHPVNCYQDDWEFMRRVLLFNASVHNAALNLPLNISDLHINPGFAIGIVYMSGCDRRSLTMWDYPSQYHFRFSDPRPISPFPVRGQLGFFDVDDSHICFSDNLAKTTTL